MKPDRALGSPGATAAVLLALLFATPGLATQEYILPTLFDVTGVAADDVLNIRSAPSPSAPIAATLSSRARDIEVVGLDDTGQWGRVNVGEVTGWARLAFLAYQSEVWGPQTLPPTLHCLGTEPFWSLRPGGDGLVFAMPEAPETALQITQVLTSGVFRDPRRTVLAQGAAGPLTAVIVPMACSDGMSDRSYGLDVTLILQGLDRPHMLTGCCSIAPN